MGTQASANLGPFLYNWINSNLGLRLLTIIDVVKDLY